MLPTLSAQGLIENSDREQREFSQPCCAAGLLMWTADEARLKEVFEADCDGAVSLMSITLTRMAARLSTHKRVMVGGKFLPLLQPFRFQQGDLLLAVYTNQQKLFSLIIHLQVVNCSSKYTILHFKHQAVEWISLLPWQSF